MGYQQAGRRFRITRPIGKRRPLVVFTLRGRAARFRARLESTRGAASELPPLSLRKLDRAAWLVALRR